MVSGFEVLGFPCNQFLKQEPGTSQEAEQFACTRYKAEYPIFQKVKISFKVSQKGKQGAKMMYQKLGVIAATITLSLVVLTTLTHGSDPDPVEDFCIPVSTDTPGSCKNSSLATPDDFVYSGIKQAGSSFSATGFAGISVTSRSFPGLNTVGMSFARADLKPGGLNVPHLHPRATEVAYVVAGHIYSGFIDTTNRVYAKVLEPGEVMVYPRGLIHFQFNVGKSMATIIGNFNSQNPGIIRIPNALFGSQIKDEVLEMAFGLTPHQVDVIRSKFPQIKV